MTITEAITPIQYLLANYRYTINPPALYANATLCLTTLIDIRLTQHFYIALSSKHFCIFGIFTTKKSEIKDDDATR